MQRWLDDYFARIDYSGPVRVDFATLVALHRAHLAAIPYENLEIQLGRTNVLAEAAFIDKIVRKRRGGWCYEMNGLLTTALREIGFTVTRVAGGVSRDVIAEQAVGNHLVGLVDLDRRYVADVGLGDGPLEPFPLEVRSWTERGMTFRLDRLDSQWWRFHNHTHGMAPTFDFTEEPRALDWYQDMCTLLQTADFSPFVNNALVIRRSADGVRALRETTYVSVANGTKTERPIETRDDYARVLTELLGTDLGPEADTLWKKVAERVRKRAAAGTATDPLALSSSDQAGQPARG
jgi:N-hydroxyarylamine O-acetyltransferase